MEKPEPKITHRDLALIGERGRPFSDPGWVFEMKMDGFRVLAHAGAVPRLVSRNGTNLGPAFPEVVTALQTLPELVLDGELVVLDAEGRPLFERLRRRFAMKAPHSVKAASATEPAVLFAFDLLGHGNRDWRPQPLLKRKAALEKGLAGGDLVQYLSHVGEQGERLYEAVDGLGLEGIVAKPADSPYRKGRTSGWLKIKTPHGRLVDAERAKWNER